MAPIVIRTAATPAEAQVLVALLQSAGIPAHVEGTALADEFALSRRLLNLHCVRVVVPAACAVQARELLSCAPVGDDELTAQALAEAPVDEPGLAPIHPLRLRRSPRRRAALLLAALLVVLFWTCLP